MSVNGMTVGAARSGGVSSYVYDAVGVEEVAVPSRWWTRRDRHGRAHHEPHSEVGWQLLAGTGFHSGR